jgi:cytochrome o ubiquinol oxidase subunit 3
MSKQPVVLSAREERDSKTMLGFWIYLMTDCVLFASLFATFAVLRNSTFGGPPGSELFSLPYVLAETLILLTSSFTCGLAILAARRRNQQQVLMFFGLTFLLGLAFLAMELTEFRHLLVLDGSHDGSGAAPRLILYYCPKTDNAESVLALFGSYLDIYF